MKKIIVLILIFAHITSLAYAEEVIDVFEEYAPVNDFVCKTYSLTLDASKNEDTIGSFYTQCETPYEIEVTSYPANGKLYLSENQFTYVPDTDFTGEDNFQYRISSNGVYSNISECMVNVSEENCEKISQTSFYYEDMKNHPQKAIAEKMVEKNIIKGERIGDKYYFFPDSQITRAGAITYLCSALEIDKDEKNTIPIIFSDTNNLCDQLRKDAYSCYSAGIITGMQADDKLLLYPDKPLKRAEMFSMLERASTLKTDNKLTLLYPDESIIPDYAKSSVKTLVSSGFLQNSKNELLRPNDVATKIEFTELLYKLISSSEESTTKTLSERIKERFYEKLIT